MVVVVVVWPTGTRADIIQLPAEIGSEPRRLVPPSRPHWHSDPVPGFLHKGGRGLHKLNSGFVNGVALTAIELLAL
jgi:hypothetical protein